MTYISKRYNHFPTHYLQSYTVSVHDCINIRFTSDRESDDKNKCYLGSKDIKCRSGIRRRLVKYDARRSSDSIFEEF